MNKILLFILLTVQLTLLTFNIQAQVTSPSIFETGKPLTLQDSLETIVSRAPVWIHTKNSTDLKSFFGQLKTQFPEQQFEWNFWETYLLSAAGFTREACNKLINLTPVPIDYQKLNDYLLLDLSLKDSNCDARLETIHLPDDPDKALNKLLIEKYFLKLISLKQFSNLSEAYNALPKNIKTSLKLKTLLQFTQAAVDFGNNNTKKSIASLRKLLIEEAGNHYETEIFVFIDQNHLAPGTFLTVSDWLKRAKNLVERGYPMIAKDIYLSLKKDNNLDLTEELAEAYFKQKDYLKASEYYEDLVKRGVKLKSNTSLTTRLTQCYSRSNQFEKAINIYKSKLSHDIQLTNQPYRLAFLNYDSGNYKQAQRLLNQLKPDKSNNMDIFWLRFWCHYFLGEYTQALELLNQSTFLGDKISSNKAIYWKARILEKLKREQEAKLMYKSISDNMRPDFYNYLAWQRLKFKTFVPGILIDLKSFNRPTSEMQPVSFTIPKTRNAIFTYLYTRLFGISGPTFENSDRLTQTENLYLSSSFNTLTAIGTTQLKVRPPNFSQQAYYWAHPLAYREWVYFYSGLQGLDPFLSLSIMKQESAFRPSVESPALALGLMQIIPQTSRDLARELQIKRFHHQDITNPANNIKLATYYLKNLSGQFNNNLPYIIASYNAGPMAVNRWRYTGDKMEPDEFIEQIPYDETQNYVKKVLTNYWTYYLLYIK